MAAAPAKPAYRPGGGGRSNRRRGQRGGGRRSLGDRASAGRANTRNGGGEAEETTWAGSPFASEPANRSRGPEQPPPTEVQHVEEEQSVPTDAETPTENRPPLLSSPVQDALLEEGETMQLDAPIDDSLDDEATPAKSATTASTAGPFATQSPIASPPPVKTQPIPANDESEPMTEQPTGPMTPPRRSPAAAVPEDVSSQDPIYLLMLETVGRMTSCYDEQSLPPAVAKIQQLVETRITMPFGPIFNKMWTELVQYHRDKGIKLQPRVSHNFRTIDTIVRNL